VSRLFLKMGHATLF